MKEHFATIPTLQEIERATKQMKNNRSSGVCDILAVTLKEWVPQRQSCVYALICRLWDCDLTYRRHKKRTHRDYLHQGRQVELQRLQRICFVLFHWEHA